MRQCWPEDPLGPNINEPNTNERRAGMNKPDVFDLEA
jgi:hypothetical protein